MKPIFSAPGTLVPALCELGISDFGPSGGKVGRTMGSWVHINRLASGGLAGGDLGHGTSVELWNEENEAERWDSATGSQNLRERTVAPQD